MQTNQPLSLSRVWEALPRMMFSRAAPPSLEAEAVDDIAYNVRDTDTLANEFDNRERRLMGRATATKK